MLDIYTHPIESLCRLISEFTDEGGAGMLTVLHYGICMAFASPVVAKCTYNKPVLHCFQSVSRLNCVDLLKHYARLTRKNESILLCKNFPTQTAN